jgi:DNA topoisomerase-1
MLRQTSPKINTERNKKIKTETEAAAEMAGLRYVADQIPGYTRKKQGSGIIFLNEKGQRIRHKKTLDRIRKLVLPPAWSDIWICPYPDGHLQATGRDARGRKQYRYHIEWTAIRNETKFSKMLVFAEKLPLIRSRIKSDLSQPGMGREKVLAAIVSIMERTMIRIGNEEYAVQNESYGLTTILNRHVKVKGQKIQFHFKGKSGKIHDVELEDRRLAGIVRKCQELPGQELFGYRNESGEAIDINSGDVNNYLGEITGKNITAKDFRTWGGTVFAAQTLHGLGPCEKKNKLKNLITQAVQATSSRLRNTPSVCRKYYIHPCVFEAYEDGQLFKVYSNCQKTKVKTSRKGLYRDEAFALKILKAGIKCAS